MATINLKGYMMTWLTKQKAKEWKAGKWKYTYTHRRLVNARGLAALTGDYIYIITITQPCKQISYSQVPKGYRDCLTEFKPIYKTRAKLTKIIRRDLRK